MLLPLLVPLQVSILIELYVLFILITNFILEKSASHALPSISSPAYDDEDMED